MSYDPVVLEKVLKRLTGVYGAPNAPDPAILYGEFSKALKGYDPSLLEGALDKVIKARTFPGWPTIGEVLVEVNNVAASRVKAPEHVKFSAVDQTEKAYVDPQRVADLIAKFSKALEANNDFTAIYGRCPAGGKINVSAPWGQEVTDSSGNVVLIRSKKRNFG